uniref:Glycosyltransferase family 2 protein n=1 Tax=Desulfatirhabdium butyrativorans TaxID=340467 RepID=A0A7C4RT02_9BACT
MPTLSIAVIACNEADRIAGLIESCRFADEILVVDSGSADGTQSLCRRLGARMIEHPWMGYAAQKQIALEACTSEWILSLDADERVSAELAQEIVETLSRVEADINGFSMPRLSRYLGRWIRHGGWYPDRKIRLVRAGKGRWMGDGLHETLVVDGRVTPLRHPLYHLVYRNISDQLATIDRFSTVHADLSKARKSGHVWLGVMHAIVKWFECYIYKFGFLDGTAGLVIAMNSAWYVFLKHAKAWEKGLSDETHRSAL